MNATLTTPDARIAAFAAAVRTELADLPGEDIDDLVDGLEADLAEQASESEGFELPDATAYAAELRAAAGLPEKNPDAAKNRVPLRARTAGGLAAASRRIRASRAGAWLVDFFGALRPVWWISRGWALYAMLAPLTGWDSRVVGFPWTQPGGWLLLTALVLLSVQWGRGRWAPVAWLRVLRTVVSVVTAIALPFLVVGAVESVRNLIEQTTYYEYVDTSQPGLTIDGERVRNIFAYDADGDQLSNVQLYDQSGRPLTTVGSAGASGGMQWDEYFYGGGGPVPVPLTGLGRAPVWNVYPLNEMPADSWENPEPGAAAAPVFPFPRVAAVPSEFGPEPTPSATRSPDAGSADPTETQP